MGKIKTRKSQPKMLYRIRYTQGNGYKCSCCRSDWEIYWDCETREEVVAWLSELEAAKAAPSGGMSDFDGREVNEIRRICEEDLKDQFSSDPAQVKKSVAARKRKKAAAKRARKKEQDQHERATFAELKAKYNDRP